MTTCKFCNASIEPKSRFCDLLCCFWSGVDQADVAGKGCWHWQKRIETSGYPRFRYGGMDQQAQRVSWAIANNVLEFGRLYNICGDLACVRPDHWSLENPRDHWGPRGFNESRMGKARRKK